MSNVEIIQAAYAAFERGDIESVIGALDPGIEWVEPEVEGLLYGGTYHGLDAVVSEVFGQMPQTWEWIALRSDEWIDGGDTVVVLGQYTGRSKGSREGTWRFAHVWKLRAGKATRVEAFFDTLAAWRTLGGDV